MGAMGSRDAGFSRGLDRTLTIAVTVLGVLSTQAVRSFLSGWLVDPPLAPTWAWAALALPQFFVWFAAIFLAVWRMASNLRAIAVPFAAIAASVLCYGLAVAALYSVN